MAKPRTVEEAKAKILETLSYGAQDVASVAMLVGGEWSKALRELNDSGVVLEKNYYFTSRPSVVWLAKRPQDDPDSKAE